MRLANALLVCLVLGSSGSSALAQDAPPPAPRGDGGRQPGGPGGGGGGGGGGRPREAMSPEKAKAAWDLQAQGVAAHLGFSQEQAKAVATAYAAARESQKAAADKQRKELMEKAREGGGGRGLGPEAMKAMEDLNKTEREKFEKALVSAGLSSEQATKAGASLGQFNPAWDVMVDTLAGFKLEAAKQQQGLNAIEEFVLAGAKARTGNPEDREANREAMQGARKKLSESLKGILDEEQLKKFESSIRGAGGRQGRPGGPEGGPEGGRRGGGEGGGGGGGGGGGF